MPHTHRRDEHTDESIYDWAMTPITYTGRTRTMAYTREHATCYHLCQPGETPQRLIHQREYRHQDACGWETTHEEHV